MDETLWNHSAYNIVFPWVFPAYSLTCSVDCVFDSCSLHKILCWFISVGLTGYRAIAVEFLFISISLSPLCNMYRFSLFEYNLVQGCFVGIKHINSGICNVYKHNTEKIIRRVMHTLHMRCVYPTVQTGNANCFYIL